MSYVMSANMFVTTALSIANNLKTLYVLGGYGHPLTLENKELLITQWNDGDAYNKEHANEIRQATEDTFAFDCICLIKAIMWGFNANLSHPRGGAFIDEAKIPDKNANDMWNTYCVNHSNDFTSILPGEMLWLNNHAGIYIGNGFAIEATAAFTRNVAITNVQNIPSQAKGFQRMWVGHAQLPCIDYTGS